MTDIEITLSIILSFVIVICAIWISKQREELDLRGAVIDRMCSNTKREYNFLNALIKNRNVEVVKLNKKIAKLKAKGKK